MEPLKEETPKKSNFFVVWLTFLAAIGGFLFGYDTGVVSGAMLILRKEFDLHTSWQELIVSITVGAAAVLAFVGGYLTDRFGRRPVIFVSSAVFTVGAILLGAANGRAMLLLGRLIVGAGIGLSSMSVPIYISEAAPLHLRGRLVSINNAFLTGGQFVASLLDGAFSYLDHSLSWRLMLGLAAIPSFIQLVGFIFMPESPRWLVEHGKYVQAQQVLERIRGNSSDAEEEFKLIKDSCTEMEKEKQSIGSKYVIWSMIRTPHLRRALILGCSLQLFQQITGINTIMYYSATIIQMAGVKNSHTDIWLSAVTAGVNFFCTFIGVYLVERIGRRLLTLFSLVGVMISLFILAIAFQLMAVRSAAVSVVEPTALKSSCARLSTCDACITSLEGCGFCFQMSGGTSNGSCLPTSTGSDVSSVGRCNHTLSDTDTLTWASNWCPTDLAWMIVLGLVLYLFAFASGMGPMPWTINAEIYPTWTRSTGMACSTATNWIFNLVVSMTFLSLMEGITKQGTYYLYTSIALVGLVFFWWVLPETKDKTLEEVEGLFAEPWFCGRKSERVTPFSNTNNGGHTNRGNTIEYF